jgi:hypothetical protein
VIACFSPLFLIANDGHKRIKYYLHECYYRPYTSQVIKLPLGQTLKNHINDDVKSIITPSPVEVKPPIVNIINHSDITHNHRRNGIVSTMVGVAAEIASLGMLHNHQ